MLEKHLSQGLRHPQSLVAPRAAESFENAMLDALLSELFEPRRPEPSLARRHIAHRAAAILHQRCREELTISDLCAVVRASRRTLHLGFLELYGVGPIAYLKILRLNGVRRELRGSRHSDLSITTAATSWGFNHLGRFSQDYASHFGVLPSVDARRK
jgi:AraC family ethanolamine operon transcriptional activator